MEYWNSLLTEKSWRILQELSKQQFRFILIGGWAAYLWTKLHKSKDIDIIVDVKDLLPLKRKYTLRKNDNLKKYEIKIDEIDIDIYVPFFSRLTIPLDEIYSYTTRIEGFEVIKPEVLLILKQGAEKDREYSVKGEKDRIDIMGLVSFYEMDFKEYYNILKKYKIEHFYERLKKIISNFTDLKYLDINPRQLKLKKKELLEKLKKI